MTTDRLQNLQRHIATLLGNRQLESVIQHNELCITVQRDAIKCRLLVCR